MQALDALELVGRIAAKEKVTRSEVGSLSQANYIIAKEGEAIQNAYRDILKTGIIHSNKKIFQLLLDDFNKYLEISLGERDIDAKTKTHAA